MEVGYRLSWVSNDCLTLRAEGAKVMKGLIAILLVTIIALAAITAWEYIQDEPPPRSPGETRIERNFSLVPRIALPLQRDNRTKIRYDLRKIYEAATFFYVVTGHFPVSINEMINAVDGDGQEIPGSLEKMPRDPWGSPYKYEMSDGKPLIICLGRDNTVGGERDDKDYQHPESEEY